MKKVFLLALLSCAIVAHGFAGNFSIKEAGGVNFAIGGDYNSAVKGISDYYRENDIVSSELKPMNLGWNFTAELIFGLSENIGLGLEW